MSIRQEINAIWSDPTIRHNAFQLWERHLHWLASLGWDQAYRKSQPSLLGDTRPSSGHEVVDLLTEFIEETGYVNAHIGLTSSDIIDNVRLMQVQKSLAVLSGGLVLLKLHINERFNFPNLDTVGFTHWQPAAPISWGHRAHAWMNPIDRLASMVPPISAKKFGGPVGDSASTKLLVSQEKLDDNPFDWSYFDLDHPSNPYPLQSTDHTCEIAAINWVCAIAAQLHKIALDMRVLASHGLLQLKFPEGHAGSSSMPHKLNPHKWEKVCSICRSISTTQQEVWAVAAHNSLERTLDGSWQLKTSLVRAFDGLAYVILEFVSVDARINHVQNEEILYAHRRTIFSDIDLTKRVIAGESRWSAYWDSVNQHKNDKR